jgi:hypothetical protein
MGLRCLKYGRELVHEHGHGGVGVSSLIIEGLHKVRSRFLCF